MWVNLRQWINFTGSKRRERRLLLRRERVVFVNKINAYLAEFIGTMVLVFMGCGAAIFLGPAVGGGYLSVAFAFGLAVVGMSYAIGNISGCHINPAVSLAMLISKKLSVKDFIGYVVAQIFGGIMGAALLNILVVNFDTYDATTNLGANKFDIFQGDAGIWGAFIVEIILTFIFIFVILGVTSDESKKGVAGIVIGLTLVLVHIVGIQLTGTSVNPARSIGPAIFAGGEAIKNVWVFIAAPLIGSALAAITFKALKD